MIDKIKAIKSLLPSAQIALADGVITWVVEPEVKPTDAEIDAELARLQAEYDAKEYQRKRAAEYPSFAEQFDLLYHGGMDAWKSAIQTVKDRYPKP